MMHTLGTVDADERRRRLLSSVEFGGSAAARGILEALGDEDWRVRKEAVGQLHSVDVALLLPGLVDAIAQGENVGLRNSAIEAVGVIGEPAVAPLVAAFDAGIGPPRRFFAAALGSTASLSASDALARACEDPDENLVAAAIDALARVGGPRAEEAIRRHLRDADSFRKLAALDSLDRLAAFVPFEEIEPILGDPVVRHAALPVLGRSRSASALPILFEALSERAHGPAGRAAVAIEHLAESSDELAERIAAEAVAIAEPTRVVLRKLLLAGDSSTRRAVALVLVLARDSAAMKDVISVAADVSLSSGALFAFSNWGASAIEPLLGVVASSTGAPRGIALELAADLLASSPNDVPASIAAKTRSVVRSLLSGGDDLTREAAIRSFTAAPAPDDLTDLVALATTARPEDAIRAASAIESFVEGHRDAVERALYGVDASLGGGSLCAVLARLGTSEAIERIVSCTSSDDSRTRRAAVLALGESGSDRVVESLALALADEDLDVRATAAMMLGRLRDRDGRAIGSERLLSAIGHELPIVQIAAMHALVDLGEARAKDKLVALASAADSGVVATAIDALRALGDERAADVALAAALKNGDADVMAAALRVVGDRDLDSAGEGLVRAALAHPEWTVRLAAVATGARSAPGRVILTSALSTEDEPMVRRAIEDSIAEEAP